MQIVPTLGSRIPKVLEPFESIHPIDSTATPLLFMEKCARVRRKERFGPVINGKASRSRGRVHGAHLLFQSEFLAHSQNPELLPEKAHEC